MTGNNGEKIVIPDQPQKKIMLEIEDIGNGQYQMRSPLPPPQLIYLMEEMKFNLFYNQKGANNKILPPSGGMMNFIRGGLKK